MRQYAVREGLPWLAAVVALACSLPVGAQEAVDLPAQDRALPTSFEEVYRIGSFDAEEWETFGEISGLAFDGAGNLHVFDRQSSRITVVSPTGKLVREVGKAGEGPGELRFPAAFTVLRDGTIVIADMGHRAYTLFGKDGAFQRAVGMGGGGNVIRIGEMSPDPRGGAVFSGGGGAVMMTMQAGRGGPGAPPQMPRERPIERISLTGAESVATTLAKGWLPPQVEQEPQEIRGGRGGNTFTMALRGERAFEPQLLMGPLADGGVAYVDSTTYAVKITAPDGKVQRVVRRPTLRPRPMTKAIEDGEKERRLDQLEERAGGTGGMRIMVGGGGAGAAPAPIDQSAMEDMMKNQIEQLTFYPEISPLLNLRTGWGGKIWAVRRAQQPNDVGAIDVLTAAGQYVGTFAAGAEFAPDFAPSGRAAFGPEGLIAYMQRDEFDVPTIIVKRLPAILR